MFIPESYPDNYINYLDYLQDFNDYMLIQEPFVPFWTRTIISLLDLIGPETSTNLEHVIKYMLESPTHDHLQQIRSKIIAEVIADIGHDYAQNISPLGRKYHVLLHLLDGNIAEPFDDAEWSACFSSYAIGSIDPEGTQTAIIDERVKKAIKNYIPENDIL
jgi:hypothetical protein